MRRRLFLCYALIVMLAGCSSSSATVPPTNPPPSVTPGPRPAAIDWPRFGFDPARSGVNPGAIGFTAASVGALRRIWQSQLPDVADSSPMLLHAVRLPDGSARDVLYLALRDGRLLALDAANGQHLWQKQPSGPKITHSSPVASADRKYVFAYGLDGFLHKYAVSTGDEVTGNGWPAQITTMTETEKESSALNEANGNIYVTTSGYIGDAPPYQGHVVAIDEVTGAEHVFNSLCANMTHLLTRGECRAERSGIWARGGAAVDPTNGDVYVTTGNGPFDANSGGQNYGDSVLALSGTDLHLLDSYTPADYAQLDANDTDLGSDAPALLPTIAKSKTPYLLVQGGKDAVLRVLNRRNLSGQGGPGHVGGELQTLPSPGCGIFTQPAVWTDPHGETWVFVAGSCGLGAFTVNTDNGGTSHLHAAWQVQVDVTTPIIAGSVLLAAESGQVLALDPLTGRELWSSAQSSARGTIGGIHWESPIATGGALYITDEDGNCTAYATH
jgi:outer membrane protein assembly factor BamB